MRVLSCWTVEIPIVHVSRNIYAAARALGAVSKVEHSIEQICEAMAYFVPVENGVNRSPLIWWALLMCDPIVAEGLGYL
jgi:hypothetical protein